MVKKLKSKAWFKEKWKFPIFRALYFKSKKSHASVSELMGRTVWRGAKARTAGVARAIAAEKIKQMP
jgi:hypothetical protein